MASGVPDPPLHRGAHDHPQILVYTNDFNTEELRPDLNSLRNRAFVHQIQ